MISNTIIKILIGFYVVLIGVSVYEKRPGETLYWLGAIILNLGVLMMKKGG